MKDDSGAYLANIIMEGEQSEHEEETGQIVLHEHAFNKDLVHLRDLRAARSASCGCGTACQTFDPLVQLQPV